MDYLKITNSFFVTPEIQQSDFGFSMGTPHSNSLFADHIFKYYSENLFDKIILTGGVKLQSGCSESEFLKNLLIAKGTKKK